MSVCLPVYMSAFLSARPHVRTQPPLILAPKISVIC